MKDVEKRLQKAQDRLATLKAQKTEIDEKIKKTENTIEKYQHLINQKKFDAATDVLEVNGLTIDDVIAAVSSGNIASLQERIENRKTVDNVDTSSSEYEENNNSITM